MMPVWQVILFANLTLAVGLGLGYAGWGRRAEGLDRELETVRVRVERLELPEAPPAVGAYVPWVQTGNLVVTSFQLPWREGVLAYTGRLGAELQTEDGYSAAAAALSSVATRAGSARRGK